MPNEHSVTLLNNSVLLQVCEIRKIKLKTSNDEEPAKSCLFVIGQDNSVPIGLHNFHTYSFHHIVTMTAEPGLPIFLENTPSVMCEQVLWLINNSGLNFQVRETPFSLDINLKKCYAKLWNLNVGNPVSSPPVHHLFPTQNHQPQETQDDSKKNSESLHQIDLLKSKLEDALKDKHDACTDLLKLDQAHRKLAKENKELLKKHELFCTEMKIVKSEKEQLSRENNSLSVALKASKKGLKENLETFEKEKKGLQIELMNLNKFNVEKEAEQKKFKRAEKKSRQRDKKLNKDYKDHNSKLLKTSLTML
jgi:hypothetical protein